MNIAFAHRARKLEQALVAAQFVGERDFIEAELAAEPREGWMMMLLRMLQRMRP